MSVSGTVFDITHDSYVDGPGIRTTVFFKGCNLACNWCHNPESQSGSPGIMFYSNKCIGCGKCLEKCLQDAIRHPENCRLCGTCALYCPQDARRICGEIKSDEEIMAEVRRDKGYYAHSGGGVTFSGGECMLQLDLLLACLKACHEEGIHTAVDTAGHVPFSSFEQVLPYTDLFLYDVKAMDPSVHKELTGVDNQRILSNLQKLLACGAHVWIRIPVIPGQNTGELIKIRDFLRTLPRPDKIELLPYHRLGEGKYLAMGKQPQCFSVPSAAEMQDYRALFEDNF